MNIRLVIHSISGPGYHDVHHHWIREEEITPEIQGYLDQIEGGLVVDDGDYEPSLDAGARKFIRDIGTENSRLWSQGDLLHAPRVIKIYTITETNY